MFSSSRLLGNDNRCPVVNKAALYAESIWFRSQFGDLLLWPSFDGIPQSFHACKNNVTVKFALEQVTMAQTGSRDIALLFL
jgi:hypothetical protein